MISYEKIESDNDLLDKQEDPCFRLGGLDHIGLSLQPCRYYNC
jgi:hypothetical protein